MGSNNAQGAPGGNPASRLGRILVSMKDDIRRDEAGLATAESWTRHVAEVALMLKEAGA